MPDVVTEPLGETFEGTLPPNLRKSILATTKANLQLVVDDTSFDDQLITFINSELAELHQIGIGPAQGFEIEDDTAIWDDFLGGNPLLNSAKNFVYFGVRLAFDPPAASYLVDSIVKQKDKAAWRLNMVREEALWDSSTV